MTMGFMRARRTMSIASVAPLAFALLPLCTQAADVAVSALFSGKAVLMVDGGRPRTLSVGQSTPEGVKLISASSESAVIEYNGQRQTLTTGQGTRVLGSPAAKAGAQVTLTADVRGHFITTGFVNGVSVNFMVDTGATTVALSTAEARRLGIDYRSGVQGRVSTANGVVAAYRIKLDTVRVGDIVLNNVDGTVIDGAGLTVALLGMSFLTRTHMIRDGDKLTLTRRF
jgi:aspartyl protease family protein